MKEFILGYWSSFYKIVTSQHRLYDASLPVRIAHLEIPKNMPDNESLIYHFYQKIEISFKIRAKR